MNTVTRSQARRRLERLVAQVQESHEPIRISGERGAAALVSEDDWRAIQETLCIVSVPGMRESIHEGLAMPVDALDQSLSW